MKKILVRTALCAALFNIVLLLVWTVGCEIIPEQILDSEIYTLISFLVSFPTYWYVQGGWVCFVVNPIIWGSAAALLHRLGIGVKRIVR